MSYRNTGCFKSLSPIVQTMCKPKPGFKNRFVVLDPNVLHFSKQKKRKKKVLQIEEMTYENGVKNERLK